MINPAAAPRRRSVLVTVAGIFLLLPGLLFGFGVLMDVILLLQGPPPLVFGNEAGREYAVAYRIGALVFDLVAALLLLPAALTLLFRWRWARPLVTLAVLAALCVPAWGMFSAARQHVSLGIAAMILSAIWLGWAAFVLISIWRPGAAAEFSRKSADSR